MLDRLPRILLRAEGAAVFAGALVLFVHGDSAWWLFPLLFLVPDVSMAGYLAGVRAGSAAYDAAHFEAAPVALAVVGVISDTDLATAIGLVWLAHIGLDRALGYGLKYPTGFQDTHLQRV
jgi:hypothetical protein